MDHTDFIIISQSEIVNYNKYSKLPIDRIDLFKNLVYPRMLYHNERFVSHLDFINNIKFGKSFHQSDHATRRHLFNIWNLPGFSGINLANYLYNFNISTAVINNFDAEWDRFCEIYDNSSVPPLVGISTTFHLSYTEIKRLTTQLRKHDQNMKIVIGGAFANSQVIYSRPEEFEKVMRKYGINYTLFGFHSECDLKNLIHSLKAGLNLRDVSNLAYIEGGSHISGNFNVTEQKWHQPTLNNISFYWDKLYLPFLNSTFQLRTSTGCPFSCAFCSYPTTAHGFHTMDIDQVLNSVDSALRIPGIDKIIFIDDTFNVPKARFKELCKQFVTRNFEWFSFLRVQFVDEETVRLMKESGCKGVYLGIESASDIILRNMNKKATSAEFNRGISLLKKYEITTMAAFVLGFPGETSTTIQENIEFIKNCNIDFYTLKEFYYMEHTSIHENRDRYNLTGMGNNWKHQTMDSDTASLYKEKLFLELDKSVFIDPDTSLWYLTYLYDHQFDIDDIKKIQTEINLIMKNQMQGIFNDNHEAVEKLKNIITQGS